MMNVTSLAQQLERDKRTLNALWKWHRAAQELGRSQRYLSRITEVAREIIKGESLSSQAKAAMQHDIETFSGQQQAHSKVLSKSGDILQEYSQKKRGIEMEE
jgi:uncharacterized membrane protein YccC